MAEIKRGKFIVVEGTDGSGKQTQCELLNKYLTTSGIDVVAYSFPQYGKKSAGPIEDYLAGNYGSAEKVGPYRASVFYAVDRYSASHEIEHHLSAGKTVICDRYVASNMGHQGSKITNATERFGYYRWMQEFEFGLFGIPKPDINIILHVPAEITINLIKKRGGPKDLLEADTNHLKSAEQTYLEIAKHFNDYTLIECAPNETLLSIEEIHQTLIKTVKSTFAEFLKTIH